MTLTTNYDLYTRISNGRYSYTESFLMHVAVGARIGMDKYAVRQIVWLYIGKKYDDND